MATTAGSMTQTPGGNPQWRACDGSIVSAFQNPLPPQTGRNGATGAPPAQEQPAPEQQ